MNRPPRPTCRHCGSPDHTIVHCPDVSAAFGPLPITRRAPRPPSRTTLWRRRKSAPRKG